MRTRLPVTWLGAATLAAAAAVALAEDAPGDPFYEKLLGKVERAAAARLWDAADRARRESLFRFARDEARRVLELDPDHRQARAFLGYVKQGDAWTMDLGASGRLPTENQEPPGASKLADLELAWRTGAAAKADADVAAMYAALGDECASKGHREGAGAAYRLALGLDRDNAAAHRGLGHVKFCDGLWLTREADGALALSRSVHPVDEPSRYDEVFRERFRKAESGHFRVESPHSDALIAGYLGACERVYAAYLADFGLDPEVKVFPGTPLFCVLGTDAHWDRWIDRLTQGNPGFWRPLTCHWARDRWACAVRNHEGATDLNRRDRLAHQTVHMMNLALWGLDDGSWLDDALAYRYAVFVHGTTYAYCLASRKEDYARSGAQRAWTDQAQWRPLLKEIVAAKDDLALRMIVNKSAYELPLFASVKAWSVADFLMRRDRPAFVAMVRETRAEKDRAALLETRFGRTVEALDDEWRRWVLETY